MALEVPDGERFVWNAQVACTGCGETISETDGKMVAIGDSIYPINLHVRTDNLKEHECG